MHFVLPEPAADCPSLMKVGSSLWTCHLSGSFCLITAVGTLPTLLQSLLLHADVGPDKYSLSEASMSGLYMIQLGSRLIVEGISAFIVLARSCLSRQSSPRLQVSVVDLVLRGNHS